MIARLGPLIEAVGKCCQFSDGKNAGVRAEEIQVHSLQWIWADTVSRCEVLDTYYQLEACSDDVCLELVAIFGLIIARNSAVV